MRAVRRFGLGVAAATLAVLSLATSGLAAPPAAAVAQTSDAATIAKVHLPDPLVRTSPTTAAEDAALARAVSAFEHRADPLDRTALTSFLAAYPKSGWSASLQYDLGISDLHEGYFSRAIDHWKQAWTLGKDATEPRARAIVDGAVGSLIRLYASLGQFDHVSALFDEIGHRPITGSATEDVQVAREELTLVTKDPRHLFNCGPLSLARLLLALDPNDRQGDFLQWYRASPNGVSLAELGGLADKAKFPYKLVFRQVGQPIPERAVIHWNLGHYSAIVGKANGRYHLADPIFPGDGEWVTQGALDEEASGYFLIPVDAPMAAGWRAVPGTEAASVWGKGNTTSVVHGDAYDRKAHGCKPGGGMCTYDIKESTVGLTLTDQPVGYDPPIGPSARVSITYNQREDSQPNAFSFTNVSPKWTLNWIDYITDDPTMPGTSASHYLPGGGSIALTGSAGQFTADYGDGSVLIMTSTSPITYKRYMADGSIAVYSHSDGAMAAPRNVFLTQMIDPQGNALTLTYDTSMNRLLSVTDAVGRVTTLSYSLSGSPLVVTQITDPFGRSATLTYNSNGNLSSITDVLGLTSSFAYDGSQLVDSMTTPYGTTTFAYTAPGTGQPRFLQITDPLGYNEREEWVEPPPTPTYFPPENDNTYTVPSNMSTTNDYLQYRNSFYWDRSAYVVAGCASGQCNYTMGRITHFDHFPGNEIKSTSVESLKYPLQNRIWYNYPGQTLSYFAGTYQTPSATGQVMTGPGSTPTQLSQVSYDTLGYYNPLQTIDPIGRVTKYVYNANHIDLSTISQVIDSSGDQATLASFTYDSKHRPLTVVDAAGKTITIAYNAKEQPLTITNPLSQTTSFAYNGTFDLTSVTNANSAAAESFTYDAFDRVATRTDSEGWTVSFAYDAADRVTKVTYPDGTSDQYAYSRLDLVSATDRLGRITAYGYDADRRLTSMTDPSGHQTTFAYNYTTIGLVISRTDPKSNVTSWAYDVQGRLTTQTYADGSATTFAYDVNGGLMSSRTDAIGNSANYTYAVDDRLATVSYTDTHVSTPGATFTYDRYYPRLTSMAGAGGTTTYSYFTPGVNGALELSQENIPMGVETETIAYAYDVLGRLTSRTVTGDAAPETFSYDAIGRLTGHTNDLGSFTLGYLGQTSQITSRALTGTSLATSWGYLSNTGDRRLASVSTAGLTSGQYSKFAFTTNAENQITGQTQTSDASVPYPPSTFSQTAGYNNLNQPTGPGLMFDADGNLTQDATRTYSWDAENRLAAIGYRNVPGKATTFTYDGLGRRISMSSTPAGGGTAVVTNYLWCGWKLCQAYSAADILQPALIKEYYAEGEYVLGSPAISSYYAPDQIGSVRRAFQTSGASPTYDYDPYGNPLQSTAPVTDFNYAGTFYNADSGLYLATHRPYDPVSGRWLSRDPIGEAGDPLGNLYAYVGGDPVGLRDPNGNFGILGAIIGAGLGASLDFGYQLYNNGGNTACINWSQVAGAAGLGALIGSGAEFLVGLGGEALAGGVAAEEAGSILPSTLARVIPNGIPATTLGAPGAADVFVTTPEAIEGLDAAGIAQTLTIPESPSGFQVLQFPTPAEGLASPVFRTNPGFVGGGYTAGGAPEYVIPNGPTPPGTTITTVR